MKPMFTALIRARKTSRGIPISDFERRRFDALREESNASINAGHAPPPPGAAPRKGLVAVIPAVCVRGVSTCSVDDPVMAPSMSGISRRRVSRLWGEIIVGRTTVHGAIGARTSPSR